MGAELDWRVWKRILFGLALVVTAMHAVRDAYWPSFARGVAELAIRYEPVPGSTTRFKVKSITDAAAVEGLGLKVGDTFSGPPMVPPIAWAPSLPIRLDSDGRSVEVPYSIRPIDSIFWGSLTLKAIIQSLLLVMAWVLLVRGSDSGASLLLAGLMLADAFPEPFTLPGLVYQWEWLFTLDFAGHAISMVLFVPFALVAGQSQFNGVRLRALKVVTALLAVLGIALVLVAPIIGIRTGLLPRVLQLLWYLAVFGLAVGVLSVGAKGHIGDQRRRGQWLLAGILICATSQIGWALLGVLGHWTWTWYSRLLTLSLVGWAALTVIVLTHRVVSVRLVVNRALIYGLLSGALVLAFALVELFSHQLLHAQSRGIPVLLETIAALAIVLVFRRIHHRLEDWVERVLFKRRHEAVLALARFERDASFITRPSVLRERLQAALGAFAGARALLYQLNGDSAFLAASGDQTIDVDDEAVVVLRATGLPVRLAQFSTPIPGEVALPMMTHGRLSGFVAIAARSQEGSYDDETVGMLHRVTAKIALDLEGLRVQELLSRIEALSASNAALHVRLTLGADRDGSTVGE